MKELKPCPFCGGNDCELKLNQEIGVYVHCPDCGVSMDGYTYWEDMVIEMWNRRPNEKRKEG